MANKIVGQRLIDSTKKAVTKIILVSDGTNEANTVLIDVSTLRFALNANSMIMSSNTHPKSKYNTTVKKIYGNLKSNNGTIRIQWHGDSNSEIIAVGSGSINYNFDSMIDGIVITNPEANSSGDILITTTGLVAGDVATLFIDLKKDAGDFDAGQTADPYAFNRG
jgi:hypothetical protein